LLLQVAAVHVDAERAAVDLAGAQLHELDRGGRDPAVAQERLDLEETLVGLGCEGGDVESCGHRNLHVSRSGRLMDGTARPDVTASGKKFSAPAVAPRLAAAPRRDRARRILRPALVPDALPRAGEVAGLGVVAVAPGVGGPG